MWHDFQEQTDFEAVVYRLTAQTLTRAAETWPGELPLVGFALNCSAAAGDISVSLTSDMEVKDELPPDWEHECSESEIDDVAAQWRIAYHPIRARYQRELTVNPDYPAHFLQSLRQVVARLERAGIFAKYPGIRLLVTEVDADTDEEERLLAEMRQAMQFETGN